MIFKLCGSPPEEYWKKSKFPHATLFKPQQPYKRCIAEAFKNFPPTSLPLIGTLLATDPAECQTALAALRSGKCCKKGPWMGIVCRLMAQVVMLSMITLCTNGEQEMDALISSSSKSYYACVGESTHAYQSPSKDLTAINNRLNGRKVSSRLNFDDIGLVSDSIVARSLYPQSGSSASSSGVGPLIAPVKCEQSDP